MVVLKPVREVLDMLDENAELLGSGKYNTLAQHLKSVCTEVDKCVENGKAEEKLLLAARTVLEMPSVIQLETFLEFVYSDTFLRTVTRIGSKVGAPGWQKRLVAGFLPRKGATIKSTHAVHALLLARVNLWPIIAARLDRLGIRAVTYYDANFNDKDEDGPDAHELLKLEPRALRWFLGMREDAQWPSPKTNKTIRMADGTARRLTWQERELVVFANDAGGDTESVNAPCKCEFCRGVAS